MVFFQLDAAGVLYVKDFSNISDGYVFNFTLTVTDNGGKTGSCSVTIIVRGVSNTLKSILLLFIHNISAFLSFCVDMF